MQRILTIAKPCELNKTEQNNKRMKELGTRNLSKEPEKVCQLSPGTEEWPSPEGSQLCSAGCQEEARGHWAKMTGEVQD